MKTLILNLILLSQVSLANSQVGNFGHGSKILGGSQCGTLSNGQGNMGGGGGLRPEKRSMGGTGGGGVLARSSNGTDNSKVGTL